MLRLIERESSTVLVYCPLQSLEPLLQRGEVAVTPVAQKGAQIIRSTKDSLFSHYNVRR